MLCVINYVYAFMDIDSHEVLRIHDIYFHYFFYYDSRLCMHFISFWSSLGGLTCCYYEEITCEDQNFGFMLVGTTCPWLGEVGRDTTTIMKPLPLLPKKLCFFGCFPQSVISMGSPSNRCQICLIAWRFVKKKAI